MAFSEKKFFGLSSMNQIKKTVYAIRQYLEDEESEIYILKMLSWLNEASKSKFEEPKNRYEWGILSNKLLQILKEENLFLEEKPFDAKNSERAVFPIRVLLDNIRSPFNVGSVFRCSEAMGVQEILCCGITPSPEKNKKVLKTSRLAKVAYSYFDDSLQALKELKKQGYFIVAVEKTDDSEPLGDFKANFPLALILGNEEFGVAPNLLEQSDAVVHIPMLGVKNSLNVSVAAGIVLHSISRSYQKSKI